MSYRVKKYLKSIAFLFNMTQMHQCDQKCDFSTRLCNTVLYCIQMQEPLHTGTSTQDDCRLESLGRVDGIHLLHNLCPTVTFKTIIGSPFLAYLIWQHRARSPCRRRQIDRLSVCDVKAVWCIFHPETCALFQS